MSAPAVRPGLILHLAGPMQSWGERSKFNERDTSRAPTRSGLLGMIASALGRNRGASIADLDPLRFAVRADRAGSVLRDFHTVGGGLPRTQTVATAEGGRRAADAATLVSTRYYLQDAAFTVAVTSTDDDKNLLSRCATALQDPHWPPYLGRRSCPPGIPVFITDADDVWGLLADMPLHRRRPFEKDSYVDVQFWADQPLDNLRTAEGWEPAGRATSSSVQDDPLSFTATDREFRRRTLHRRTLRAPAASCADLGSRYIRTLTEFLANRTHDEPGKDDQP